MSQQRPLTQEELASIRSKTADVLAKLQQEVSESESNGAPLASWLGAGCGEHVEGVPAPTATDTRSHATVSTRCRFFHQQGFLLVPNFCNADEIQQLKSEMKQMVDTQWDPTVKTLVFGTDEASNRAQGSDDYFLESASRVHYFAEADAVLDDKTGELKPQYQTDKLSALNKAGHGMHVLSNAAFHDYAASTKVAKLVQELGWRDPVVPQSMYIFKQPHIGGAVNSHQDSTFLYTTPRQTCLGLWLALDDATLQNGCLWVRPKSHWEPVRRKFKRNPLYFGKDAIERGSNIAQGDTIHQPKMLMETLHNNDSDDDNGHAAVPWEGLLPDGSDPPCDGLLERAGFIPVECKAGDLVCFPGQLDHLSLPNTSDEPRHTFQLHLVEGQRAGITWSKTNWLQYPQGMDFMSIERQQARRYA